MIQATLAYLIVAAALGWLLRGYLLRPFRKAAQKAGAPSGSKCDSCDCGH